MSRLLSRSRAGIVTAQDCGSVVVACEAARSWATAAALLSDLDLSRPPALTVLQLSIRPSSVMGSNLNLGISSWVTPLEISYAAATLSCAAQDYGSVVDACEAARP